MEVRSVFAQATVRDQDQAEEWYTALLGRGPDARPMDGLLEWHFGETTGVQVWADPDRAGRSTVTITVADLDAVAGHVREVGLADAEPTAATASRILQLTDPDGNRIVVAGD